jgi:hypothetical protein
MHLLYTTEYPILIAACGDEQENSGLREIGSRMRRSREIVKEKSDKMVSLHVRTKTFINVHSVLNIRASNLAQ